MEQSYLWEIREEYHMIDIVIVALIGTALAAVIWKKVKDRKEGKSGCGCGCGGGCSSSSCSGCNSGYSEGSHGGQIPD